MIKLSNVDVLGVLRKFKQRDIKTSFLVPTPTGLSKSIMDATEDLRTYLSMTGMHDFVKQQQGQAHKHLIPTTLVSGGVVKTTKTSLYRPTTKQGDPRVWVYDLAKVAEPGDLLAFVKSHDGLAVINCSTTDLDSLLDHKTAKPVSGYESFVELKDKKTVPVPSFQKSRHPSSGVYSELLHLLHSVSRQGFIRTLRKGDTGIGYTLETKLGIPASSSKAPDYKGIEIKSGRARTHARGQVQIFSQVPNWKISNLKSSKELLMKRGRYNERKQRRQLYHEISAQKPNSYGLQLEMDYPISLMHQVFVLGQEKETDVSWALGKLKERLLQKHRETVWVTAKTRGTGLSEEFWYIRSKHTSGANVDVLPLMLETGAMTVHYTIREKLGKDKTKVGVKDHGYLFKTAAKNIDLLFENPEEVDLTDPNRELSL